MGSFEKSILGILAVLFGIYWALDHYYPVLIYPELRQAGRDPSVLINPAPRQGQVLPASEYSTYLANPASFLAQSGGAFDPTKINWFAKGTDGAEHPSNAYFLKFVPFETKKFWVPLLAESLRVHYIRDDEIKPGDDTWQTSYQTYTEMRGDCEDHAILLADWMIGLGYDARVVLGTVHNEGHAWVVLYQDGKEYLLETTDKASRRRYPLVALHPEYIPAYMFNRDSFWGRSTPINRYQPSEWVLISEFRENAPVN